MARELLYKGGVPSATVNIPATPQVMGPPSGAFAANQQLIQNMGENAQKVIKGLQAAYVQRQENMLADADLQAQKQMTVWKQEYMRTHKGVDALEAQAAFENQWNTIAQDLRVKYGDKIGPEFQQKFERQMALRNIYAIAEGGHYQSTQDTAWRHSVSVSLDEMTLSALAEAADDPARQQMIIQEYRQRQADLHPGLDRSGAVHKMEEAAFTNQIGYYLNQNTPEGVDKAQALLDSGGDSSLGHVSAKYESGSSGIHAIGYDKNGGTSYGKWQLSSRQGSFMEWRDNYLAKAGPEGAEAARRLREAGNPNTGSRNGQAVDVYKELSQKYPDLFERTQRAYIQGEHYGPMLKRLSPEQRQRIESSPMLQEMAWSTAVQHGGAGGARVLAGTVRVGDTDEGILTAVYDKRKGQFGSSTPEVQTAVRSRLDREKSDIMNGGGSLLSQAQRMTMQNHIDAARRRMAQDSGLTAQSFNDSVAIGWDRGDFSASREWIDRMRPLDGKKAADMEKVLQFEEQAHSLLKSVESLPFAEQAQKLTEDFDKLVTPENAAHKISVRDHAYAALQKAQVAFQKDPMGYVMQTVSTINRPMPEKDRIEWGFELQRKMAGDGNFQPKVLSKERAEAMKAEFDGLTDSMSRLTFIQGLRANFGEYAGQAMAEMKMPAALGVMASLTNITPASDMADLIDGVVKKNSEKFKDSTLVKSDVTQQVTDSDLYKTLQKLVQVFPHNDNMEIMLNGVKDSLTYFINKYGDLSRLSQSMNCASGDGYALILPKDGPNMSSVVDAMGYYRIRGLGEDLRKAGVFSGPVGAGPASRQQRANREKLAERAFFISTDDGTKAYLADPFTQRPLQKANGERFEVDLNDMIKRFANVVTPDFWGGSY